MALFQPITSQLLELKIGRSSSAEVVFDATNGLSGVAYGIPAQKRTRPEYGGGYGSTDLGWTNGVLSFVVDDDETTRPILYDRTGNYISFSATLSALGGGFTLTGRAYVEQVAHRTSQQGRRFTVRARQHETWLQS